MRFLRHVGKHGDRKVAVVFREVPDEPHMCLVIYTELLNRNLHDSIMNVIENDIGQSTENLYEALNRSYTKDGKPILAVLHTEGYLKKVQTDLIVMTPVPNQTVKLSELNKILMEMKQGEDAVKRLAELDKSHGLQHPADVARRMRNDPAQKRTPQTQSTPSAGALDDIQLAATLRQQAEKMSREAQGLLAEAQRLQSEADSYEGLTKKELVSEGVSDKPAGAKRGRKPKVKSAE